MAEYGHIDTVFNVVFGWSNPEDGTTSASKAVAGWLMALGDACDLAAPMTWSFRREWAT